MRNSSPDALAPLRDDSKHILFVLGAARSGTTYLNLVLDEFFDYGMGPEGTFVAKMARSLSKYGDLSVESNLDRLIADVASCEMLEIIRSKWREDLRFDVTPENIRSQLPEPSYAGVVYSVFSCVAQGQDRSRVGNKDPAYWRCLPLLDRLFPTQAKYLAIVRDGRDVALSLMKVPWGYNSVYTCAKEWVRSLQAVEAFSKVVGPERLLVVRYEDLLSDPITSLERIEKLVGVTLSDEQKTTFMDRAANNPKQQNSFKWHSKMSDRDKRIFESIAAPWLQSWDYEVVCDGPVTHLHESLYFEAEEFSRKVKRNLARFGANP